MFTTWWLASCASSCQCKKISNFYLEKNCLQECTLPIAYIISVRGCSGHNWATATAIHSDITKIWRLMECEKKGMIYMQKMNGSDLRYLTEMSYIKLIGKFESGSCTKLPALFPIFHGFFSAILLVFIMVTNGWRGVVCTFRLAIWGSKHAHLAKVRNFYHNGIIINWEGLFPWLPINSHECMVSCTLTELKTESFCLHAERRITLETWSNLTGIWYAFKQKSRRKKWNQNSLDTWSIPYLCKTSPMSIWGKQNKPVPSISETDNLN